MEMKEDIRVPTEKATLGDVVKILVELTNRMGITETYIREMCHRVFYESTRIARRIRESAVAKVFPGGVAPSGLLVISSSESAVVSDQFETNLESERAHTCDRARPITTGLSP
ncbi:hypothetical protein HAX54_039852 [Datura stramonium]|uniref:Uncharacterized protein n=1 Tax=Datura stramonium TaxID=4076 RepID=A0ABS8SJJ4_DATST|nr:hypothetical protein [Datura stramonium]